MDRDLIKKYVFIAALVLLTYLTYLLVKPYFTYVVFGLVLVIAFRPLYDWISNYIKWQGASSVITIVLVLLIVIIPSFFIIRALVQDVSTLISNINPATIRELNDHLSGLLGTDINISQAIMRAASSAQSFLVSSGIGILGSLADMVVGLFIMILITYYGLIEGPSWIEKMSHMFPFDRLQKKRLETEMRNVIKFVLYGQVAVSLVQGALGAAAFFFLGIPNPIFWGVLMAIFALLPFVGAVMIWLPAAFFQFFQGNIFGGVFLIIYGILVINGIEYILRPFLISSHSKTHPLILLIGLFGGIKLFGFFGIVVGPLIAAIFATLVTFYYQDHVKQHFERQAIQPKKN